MDESHMLRRGLPLIVLTIVLTLLVVLVFTEAKEDTSRVVEVEVVKLSNAAILLTPPEESKIERLGENRTQPIPAPTPTPQPTPTEDRTKPIYEVYKNGYPVSVSAEIQWMIRDFAQKYGFNEKIIFGLALCESTFQAGVSSSDGKSHGLYQIQKFWIGKANIAHFTSDFRQRSLHNPYDATLTLMEMWCYARDNFGINLLTENGYKELLYWHNTGSYTRGANSSYTRLVLSFANELKPLQ